MDGGVASAAPPWRIIGGPGSPYSLKLRAVFRYRRIPHVWVVPRGWFNEANELAEAGKGMLPVLRSPDGDHRALRGAGRRLRAADQPGAGVPIARQGLRRPHPLLEETCCLDLLRFREGEAARASEIRPQ